MRNIPPVLGQGRVHHEAHNRLDQIEVGESSFAIPQIHSGVGQMLLVPGFSYSATSSSPFETGASSRGREDLIDDTRLPLKFIPEKKSEKGKVAHASPDFRGFAGSTRSSAATQDRR